MSDTLLRQIAVINESRSIGAGDLARVSAALQKQATRDLIQFWNVKATVDAFPTLEDMPIGYWPIIIKDDIETSGAAGVHLDENGEPFALVTAAARLDEWSLTASHELVEMLVDPFGNRLMAADSPKRDQGRVQVLVEACDPSEAAEFAYTVNGILVSDFYSVRYFDPVAAPGVRYSFTGAIQKPRQVLRGGYLSWLDPASGNWWQETWLDGGPQPTFRSLGKLSAANGSFRSQIDRHSLQPTRPALTGGMRVARASGLPSGLLDKASAARATSLRAQIAELTGEAPGGAEPQPVGIDGPAVPSPLRAAAGAARRSANGRMPGLGQLREAPRVWEQPDDPAR